ncbi:hypothetical protein OBBRIDRAFT_558503 [Obba rivulosa]|uniref:Uncharacterized protein n=1 Tax=Obba rivulosa TaxID=1052685 RepID=A0A8E2AUR8_9APHY|nr:hypothetical protein OBBRIDRAFT_558503 [Obba rivulosa]
MVFLRHPSDCITLQTGSFTEAHAGPRHHCPSRDAELAVLDCHSLQLLFHVHISMSSYVPMYCVQMLSSATDVTN